MGVSYLALPLNLESDGGYKLSCRLARGVLIESDHMRIDVELAYTVCMLRKRERELAQRAQDLKVSCDYPF